MSLQDQTMAISYLCDGATFEFVIPFDYWAASNVKVELKGITGILTDLEYGVDYIVDEAELTTVAIYDAGEYITIYRDTTRTQETTRETNGVIASNVIDDDFDKGTMIDQENDHTMQRTLRAPTSDDELGLIPGKSIRADQYLKFDSNGDPEVVPGVPGVQGPQGDPGIDGTNGTDGTDGTDGLGVPSGGTTGQVLTKDSATENDTSWQTPANPDPFIVGDILMHDGTWVDNVTRVGWYACIAANSAQGCPDLEDTFIKGSAPADVGDTGGSNTHTLTEAELPTHAHSINHNHPAASTGAHIHNVGTSTSSGTNGTTFYPRAYDSTPTGSVYSTTPSINLPAFSGTGGDIGSGTAHNNEPQYYKLIYIRKCA